HIVATRPGIDAVPTGSAVQQVIAVEAEYRFIAPAAPDGVVALATDQRQLDIGAGRDGDAVVALAAPDDQVGTGRKGVGNSVDGGELETGQRIDASRDNVVARAGVDDGPVAVVDDARLCRLRRKREGIDPTIGNGVPLLRGLPERAAQTRQASPVPGQL